MSWLLIIAVVVLVLVVLGAIAGKKASETGKIGFPYQSAKSVFSAAERSFLGVLDQALGPDYRVFGKVRVADIANLKPGLAPSARQGALNRIAAKHFDFVVCRSGDLAVLCAVELNDKSHLSQRAQIRDDFLADVCRAIALPLLQIPAKQSYSPQNLREQIMAAIAPVATDGLASNP